MYLIFPYKYIENKLKNATFKFLVQLRKSTYMIKHSREKKDNFSCFELPRFRPEDFLNCLRSDNTCVITEAFPCPLSFNSEYLGKFVILGNTQNSFLLFSKQMISSNS